MTIRQRRAIVSVLTALMTVLAASAGWAAIPSGDEEDLPILEDLLELESEIELGLYLVKTALITASPADAEINIPALIGLLEGSPTEGQGALALVEEILDAIPALDLSTPAKARVTFAMETAKGFLTLCLEQARGVESTLDNWREREVVLSKAYASIAAALGEESSASHLGGIREALRLLRDRTVFVAVGESIQDAIDRILPGGTIYLEPGVHLMTVPLVIYKDLTLAREPGATAAVTLDYGRANLQTGLTIASDIDSITVHLEDFGIVSARIGLATRAKATVNMKGISLSRNRMGIQATGSILIMTDCLISENKEYGMLVNRLEPSTMTRCAILNNGTLATAQEAYRMIGGIRTEQSAVLELQDCEISGNLGYGIFAQGNTALTVRNARIMENAGEGILLFDRGSLTIYDTTIQRNGTVGLLAHSDVCTEYEDTFISHYYQGEIFGAGNLIPGPGEPDANLVAGICPDGYENILSPN